MRWQSRRIELGQAAPEFDLPDPSGERVRLPDVHGKQGLLVAFICNHCPFVQHIVDGLVAFANDYAPRGIGTVAISSNDIDAHPEDDPQQMARFAARHEFRFPYLYDASQSVAKAFGAACTPDLFLYDAQRRLFYHGQFDGSRPQTAHTQAIQVAVTGEDLRNAADRLLAAMTAPQTQLPSVGCSMKWTPANAPDRG